MEGKHDQAVRARDMANLKFSKGDFHGAKKLALTARTLFPTLKGLSQLLHVLEIHTVAQSKLGDTVMDWYGILQVDPGADIGSIKKQYRKLALLVHPDKNEAVGAEAAFKLVSEALETLSNKENRALHDMEREKVPHSMEREQVHHDTEREKAPNDMEREPAHHDMERNTIWSACPSCKLEHQYLRKYVNQLGWCSDCKKTFVIQEYYMERDTISTACPSCKTDYQYLRKHENQVDQCSGCKTKFVIQDHDIKRDKVHHDMEREQVQHDMEREPAHRDTERETARNDMEREPAHNDMERDTIWTACPNCKTDHQYLRKYINQVDRCPRCRNIFVIHDIESNTISTACPTCKTDYQYLRIHENQVDQCSGCKTTFVIQDRTVTGNCSHENDKNLEAESTFSEDKNVECSKEEENMEEVQLVRRRKPETVQKERDEILRDHPNKKKRD